MRRSVNPRRCTGGEQPSIRPIPPFLKAPPPSLTMSKLRRSSLAAWVRSASSNASTGLALRECSSRVSGLFRATAISCAGTAFPSRLTRRTGPGGRLADRGRIASIEVELASARAEVEAKRHAVEAAEAAAAEGAEAETRARAHWRDAQHSTDSAREEHAAAEREISRNAARISALTEARQRISAR